MYADRKHKFAFFLTKKNESEHNKLYFAFKFIVMKKILTLLVIASMSLSSFAQTVWKDTVEYKNFPKDGFVHGLWDTLYNNTNSPITVTWTVTNISLLSGWEGIGICDAYPGGGTCFGWTDLVTPKTFTIPANSSATLEAQVKAPATAADGSSYVTLSLSGVANPMVFKFTTTGTINTKDFYNSNLVNIYPNPATNFVNIALNDNKISSINVVNVIGRRIAKFNVDPAKNDLIHVPLDKVSDGIYLLQFADINGKVLGVRRVTKQ